MKHFRSKILLAFLLIFGLLPIAFSDWIVSDKDNNVSVNESSKTPVCYINSDTEANRYYAIEKALQKANSGDIVYVIPKTNPTINHDCEIKSGVTLIIGGLTKGGTFIKDSNGNYTYADHGVTNEKDASTLENSADNRGPHFTTETFADSYTTEKGIHGQDVIVEYSDTYRQNLVTLKATLTIRNNSQLNIGGRLGREGAGISGLTTGDYCEIVMTGNGKIENYGIIDCLGYIKQQDADAKNAIVNCYSGSTMKMPFIIQDFNGGNYTVACNPKEGEGQKVMPFNEWVCCNVQVKQTYFYNSALKGYYDVYNSTHLSKMGVTIQKGHKWGEVDLIGSSNAVITFDNNKKDGSVVVDTITDDYKHTTISSNRIINKKNKLSFYGNCGINQMKIPNPMPDLEKFSWILSAPGITNVEIGDVYTSKFFFSLNHYYDADIYGTLNVGTDQKVLPGCNITVKKGGTLKITSKVIFVENLDEVAAGATKAYKYPTIYNQAKNNSSVLNALKVEGSLVVDGAKSAIGGKIYSSTIDSSVDLLGANAVNVTYKEGANGVMNGFNFDLTYQDPAQSENARGPVLSGSSVSVSDFSKSMYVYTQEGNNIGWKAATDLDTFNVIFHLNGGSASYDDGYKKNFYLKKGETKTITSISMEEPTKSHYTFEGWYLDGSFATSLSSGVEVKNGTVLNLYAKYGLTKYQVTYNIQNASDIEANFVNPNTLTEFTYTDFVNNGSSYHIEDATSNIPEQIMFDGWYTDPSYSIDSKLSGNNITECKNYDLYGRFVKVRPTIKIVDPYFDGYTNTFIVDESGKLSSDAIGSINQTISLIRKDGDKAQYITGYEFDGVAIDLVDLKNYVFTDSGVINLSKADKYQVKYDYGTKGVTSKYYTRDSSGLVEGSPIMNDPACYDDNDRHYFDWKSDSSYYGNNEIVKILNENRDKNDFNFTARWAYRADINIVAMPNTSYVKINGVEYGVGNTSVYICEGISFEIAVNKTNEPSIGGKKHTQVNIDGNNVLNNYVAEIRPSGDKTTSYNMPSKTITIVVNRADKI